MYKDVSLRATPQQATNIEYIKTQVSPLVDLPQSDITLVKIIKRSIDARQKQIWVNLTVRVYFGQPEETGIKPFNHRNVSDAKEILIVGAGPAGLFAALTLIEHGFRPIIIERGKEISQRKADIASLNSQGLLNTESNYCFGEGGAGTFSDGKLYTRSNKRGDITRVLELFVLHGANPDILIESHPHLGTDKLPATITNMRKTIIDCGGSILFNAKVTDFIVENHILKGVKVNNAEIYHAMAVILATGHSARDIYYALQKAQVPLTAKPFAMGVRVEHPRELIDSIQYHGSKDTNLPAASYTLKTQVENRGVYSFCMCPGGIVVPSSTNNEEIVVNGMSNSQRNSPFSNSGIAVEITLNDCKDFEEYGAVAGLEYQKQLEHLAWTNSDMTMKAPSQRLVDFVSQKATQQLPASSYIPGLFASPMQTWLPEALCSKLQQGCKDFGKKMRGFLTNEAVIIGVESRTSSPVCIPRGETTFEHITIGNLYPCGEGAGYAGGITSSAMDGIACAQKIAAKFGL